MGIGWSCIAIKRNSSPPPPPAPAEPIPDSDPVPSSIANAIDDDTSFLGSNVSCTSLFSMATTMLSQVSGAVGAFWGNNTNEENEFTMAIEDENLPEGGTALDSKLQAFTFAQLKASTSNFRQHMLLGKGGFGSVYKGWIKEKVISLGTRRRDIAVKKLDANSKQGFRQWRTEVGFLARLSHPNIVKLLGYCKENENYLVVYEFMQKGSLNYHLFRNIRNPESSNRLLTWKMRLKVMTGMAQGLSYLHTREKPIIYRDFKSSNVLLDESYNAKISDFGLAKWGPTPGNTFVSGHVMGTVGYTAPEYITKGHLYVKSDVYSFGVVLVEMLTGLRAIDRNRPSGQQNLVEWVKPGILSNKRKLLHVMDSRLEGKYPAKEAVQIAMLALKCLEGNPTCRPSMKEVADTLEQIEARYRTNNEG